MAYSVNVNKYPTLYGKILGRNVLIIFKILQ